MNESKRIERAKLHALRDGYSSWESVDGYAQLEYLDAWDDDKAEPVSWPMAIGVFLLVTGVGPIIVAQLAWWLMTGERM